MRKEHHISRRKALSIVAGAAGVPIGIVGLRALAPQGEFFHWQGEVLGAASELTLWHNNAAFARAAIVKVREEIARLESIFSLYRSNSEIARLNRDGRLAKPSPELRALVEESQRMSEISGGAFDISVQPLWSLYEAHFWSHDAVQPDIDAKAREVAKSLVDYRRIDSGRDTISFMRPGMGITLNSIAQGYITDRITNLLRQEGFESALTDLGETRALGRHPEGRPWRVGLRGNGASVDLENMALAVSGGYGTEFEASGRYHHIFDPKTGASANALAEVAVLSPSAAAANALATAICVAGETRAPKLLAAYPGTRAVLTRTDGTTLAVSDKGSFAA